MTDDETTARPALARGVFIVGSLIGAGFLLGGLWILYGGVLAVVNSEREALLRVFGGVFISAIGAAFLFTARAFRNRFAGR